jgi:hypothetical protein
VKKAHTLPHQSHFIVCCVANFYTFRRPDVKMTEKSTDVNRKICAKSEEYSDKMKKSHLRFAPLSPVVHEQQQKTDKLGFCVRTILKHFK